MFRNDSKILVTSGDRRPQKGHHFINLVPIKTGLGPKKGTNLMDPFFQDNKKGYITYLIYINFIISFYTISEKICVNL